MKRTFKTILLTGILAISANAVVVRQTIAAQSTSSPAAISKQELMVESAQSTALSTKPISKQELALMIENARTPADHLKIADYYNERSKSLLAESIQHARMGADYARSPVRGVHNLYDHCAWLTKHLKAESLKDSELAKQHEQMAKDAGHPVPASRLGK